MASLTAFAAEDQATVSIAASTLSDNVQVQTGGNSRHVRVFNSGSVTAFVRFSGDGGVTADATKDIPVPANAVEIFSAAHPYAAAVTASGTATLYFTPGEGL